MSFLEGLVKERNGTYSIKLDHGTSVAMVSDNKGPSFQADFEHCVPKRKNVVGMRYNITFRAKTINPERNVESIVEQSEHHIPLNKNSHICMWQTGLFSKESVATMFDELKSDTVPYTADKTYVFGKWHTNNGRTYVEMGWTAGQTYAYAGKTTDPGIEFPPEIKRNVVETVAPLFGVEPCEIWAHVVRYPCESSLGWHSDSEQGIDPHFILSTTFLEHHGVGKRKSLGARDFQIRKKKKKSK